MIKYLISKWTLALLGTIVLGAIGSGVWDVVFKPFFSWIAEILLNVATLGLAAIRDEMYVEIAKGTYERAGVALLSMFSWNGFCFFCSHNFVITYFFENAAFRCEVGLFKIKQSTKSHFCFYIILRSCCRVHIN
jgi:hypothetical protein